MQKVENTKWRKTPNYCTNTKTKLIERHNTKWQKLQNGRNYTTANNTNGRRLGLAHWRNLTFDRPP